MTEATGIRSGRSATIDVMKVWGVWLMLYWHLTAPVHAGLHFSYLGLWFFLAGYLFNPGRAWGETLRREFVRTLLPGVLMVWLVYFILLYNPDIPLWQACWRLPAYSLYGCHGTRVHNIGLQTMWIVYAFVLLRVLRRAVSLRALVWLSAIGAVASVFLDHWLGPTVTLLPALPGLLPLFAAGAVAREAPVELTGRVKGWAGSPRRALWLLPLLVTMTFVAGNYNGSPHPWQNVFGRSHLVFYAGTGLAFTATWMVARAVAWVAPEGVLRLVTWLSRGALPVVALHPLLSPLKVYVPDGVLGFLFPCVAYLAFLPLIRLLWRYAPWWLGAGGKRPQPVREARA